MEENKMIPLGIGHAQVDSQVTWLAPGLCGKEEIIQKIQRANIEIFGHGPFVEGGML